MSTTTSVYLTTGPNAAVKCPISWKKKRKENSRHCESSSIFLVHSNFLLHCPLSCHEFYSVAIPFLEFSQKSKLNVLWRLHWRFFFKEKRSLASLCDLKALASEILDLRALASEDLRVESFSIWVLRSEGFSIWDLRPEGISIWDLRPASLEAGIWDFQIWGVRALAADWDLSSKFWKL